MILFKRIFALLGLLGLLAGGQLFSQDFAYGPVDAREVEAELVADVAAIQPGQSFDLAIRMKMDPHWHVYWINPGDTGMAPTVAWQLPEGFEVGELRFPFPRLIPTPPYMSYGYEDEIYLLAKATAPVDLKEGQVLTFKASVEWLVCAEACVPGDAKVALDLPVSAAGAAAVPSSFASQLATAASEIPALLDRATIQHEFLDEVVVVMLNWKGLEGLSLEGAYFFVDQESIVDSAKPQSFDLAGETLRISIPKTQYFDASVEKVSGVLYSPRGFGSLGGLKAAHFDPARNGGVGSADAPAATIGSGSLEIGFLQALLYAFLGGMILNLMPCVFPVLSIKIMGFVQQSGEDKGKILRHGLIFSAGVLVSFWALAGTLIALRSAGESLGWGFQLQQPEFVVVLLTIMFLFGLSLAGVFELGTSAISLAGKVKSEGYAGSFFSGVIATAVATPCTGPFMGQALGFALTLSAVEALSVFTFLALGMAAPYLLLSANPRLINKLPRPGPWMETFKQLMAFPMFATCIWLIWLLGTHVGNDGLIYVMGGLLTLAMGAWVYGRWATPVRKAITRRLAMGIALLFGLAGLWLMFPRDAAAEAESEVAWQEFSPELISELRAAGKPIFVDFTADWCLTCKANEARVFSSGEVRARFEEKGVAMVKADWTKRNPVITKALEQFGRSGVPLYLLYDGEPASAPKILPQLLDPDTVLDALSEIDPGS